MSKIYKIIKQKGDKIMKTKLTSKVMSMFLTLGIMIAFAPMLAFAAELDFLPQGVTYSKDNKHTYHTQVNVTANVSVKDSDGTVIETTQVSKSTEDFLEGGVGTLQGKLANLQTEIETPYKANGTVTRENLNNQVILDHFETATFYKFTPTSGDTIDFITDLEKAKQYFNQHSDATGTFTELLDMHEYQKHNYTYDLTVQENSQSAGTITEANIENAKFDYQPGDTPQATARVPETDTDKYEIEYESWQQFENNNPVAAWYSDNSSHGSLPTITKFESGKSYVYSLMLKPKDGYSFSSETVITVNGQKVAAPFVGGSMYIPSIKTITINTAISISNYKVIEGSNSSWVQNSNETLTFRVDGDLSKFVGVKVDDEWIDKENYTATSGSTIVTLKNEYLKTLPEGKHKITFVYTDGEVSTNFEVKGSVEPIKNSDDTAVEESEKNSNVSKSDNPKTGDNINILVWISLFSASVIGVSGITIYSKKKKSIV